MGGCVQVLPIGLSGQLSVDFLTGEDWSWCALASFLAGSAPVLGPGRHFGVSFECPQYIDMFE